MYNMVRVKIFTMQKDEEDILEDWILYHAYLFGMSNIYIIDNYSGRESIEILKKYESQGLHWLQRPDYSHKGDYLFELIKEVKDQADLVIPVDIDEFIGLVDINQIPHTYACDLMSKCRAFDPKHYQSTYPQVHGSHQDAYKHFVTKGYLMGWNPTTGPINELSDRDQVSTFLQENKELILKSHPHVSLTCDRSKILEHLASLPPYGRYSFLYYITNQNKEIDYIDPMTQITRFDVVDYEYFDNKGNYNKKFFRPQTLVFLDHGNHHGRVEGLTQNQYINSHLVLFHYHHRGVRRLISKCRNDIKGLGYVKDLGNLRDLRDKIKQNVRGSHNIQTYLTYLTVGPQALLDYNEGGFEITQLGDKIRSLRPPKNG